ncbi:MAG: hypothetical protein V2B19_13380 [Pseudomonadota bacterium]
MRQLKDVRFRKADIASLKAEVFKFDSDMLKILSAIDERKTVLQIVREVNINSAVFREALLRLVKLKLIEEVNEEITFVGEEFFALLKDTLVKLLGTIGETLIVNTAEKMNLPVAKIPVANVAEFVYEIAKEIPEEKKPIEFKKLMIQHIKKEIGIISKKEKCKKMMEQFFGPAAAATVDDMDETDCIEKCKAKVAGFFGPEKAKAFDKI